MLRGLLEIRYGDRPDLEPNSKEQEIINEVVENIKQRKPKGEIPIKFKIFQPLNQEWKEVFDQNKGYYWGCSSVCSGSVFIVLTRCKDSIAFYELVFHEVYESWVDGGHDMVVPEERKYIEARFGIRLADNEWSPLEDEQIRTLYHSEKKHLENALAKQTESGRFGRTPQEIEERAKELGLILNLHSNRIQTRGSRVSEGEGRRRFSDLTRQEKVWVVGGTAEGLFIIAVGLLYHQFFLVKDEPPFHIVGFMNTGKILTAAIVLVPSFFLIVIIPAVVLFVPIACYFAHQSAFDTLKLIVFAMAFLTVPMAYMMALLTFLALFFSETSIAFQSILMILTFFTSLVVIVRVLKFKKVQGYLRFR